MHSDWLFDSAFVLKVQVCYKLYAIRDDDQIGCHLDDF